MEFGILGPLEVGGVPFRGGPSRGRCLSPSCSRAARLCLDGTLIDAVWGERPPASAAHALQVYVSELRKAGLEIERHGEGYRLQAARLDAAEFEELVEAATGSSRVGTPRAGACVARAGARPVARPCARRTSRTATASERSGTGSRSCASRRSKIAPSRRWRSVARSSVTELEQLATEHPLRERLRGLLMLALYRAGRQAEALDAYAEIRQALDELGLEPAAELRALQGAILRQDAALDVEPEAVRQRRHLPAPATPFIGRREEVDAVKDLLRGETRLVTLTGPGGAGKTRVALRVAHELADAFADGVWFVGLAPLVDPALVRPAIAQALGHAEEALADELHDRELLLLLDNFEQLLDAAPSWWVSCCRPRRACAC